jgi:hypothetical protein
MSELVTVTVNETIDDVTIGATTTNSVVNVTVNNSIDDITIEATTTNSVVDLTINNTIQDVTILPTSGGNVTIENSDATYSEVASTSPFILPDTDYNFIVNGGTPIVETIPSLKDETFNIVWQ